MHLDKKIYGMILCANNSRGGTLTPKMLNKTKNTSHGLRKMPCREGSMVVMFYPLDDTTLVVEAGDNVVLEFTGKSVFSFGLSLIYYTDVLDSKLAIQNVS